MAITLKQVLDGDQGQQVLYSRLNETRLDLIRNIKAHSSKAKIGPLEGKLNRLFYPIGSTSISKYYYQERMRDASLQNIDEIFQNFDFKNNTSGHYKAKTAISPNTLRRSLEGAKYALIKIQNKIQNQNSLTSFKKLDGILNDCNKIIAEGEKILRESAISLQFGQPRITGDNFQKALIIVNQLDAFSKTLSIKDFITPQDAGILFEKALAMTNFVEDSTENIIDETVKTLAASAQYGAESIRRGVENSLISQTVKINSPLKKALKKDKNFKLSKDGMTISYQYDPGQARQGKMDVQLRYGKFDSSNYRISAKRWGRGYGDLGTTSIDAGLTRSVGSTLADIYRLSVLQPRQDQMGDKKVPKYIAASMAHEMARVALKSDIAMGLNQGITASGAGYANLLIVDTGEAIKVKDLADIVLDKKSPLSGYDEKSINSKANEIYRRLKAITSNRTISYLMLMSSTLHKMKVTINLSVENKI